MQLADQLERVSDQDLKGGSKLREEGIEFSLFSQNATKVELCLFSEAGDLETNRYALHQYEDHIWRGFLPGKGAGLKYGYRVHGPYDPANGHWFNPHKLLVDPFARCLFGSVVNNPALFSYTQEENGSHLIPDTVDNAAYVPKSVVILEGERSPAPLNRPLGETIIYELHVRGYSKQHQGLPEPLRGTFEGLTSEPLLKHMRDLGITAVELLPVYPFNDEPHLWPLKLSNYWGYNPYNFFAPDPRYGTPEQFRAMVQKFHDANIEVLLDAVYNHTGEGELKGPTLSLRGIDNTSYYRHLPHEPGTYVNDTGCGNTLDLDHPYVCEMVLSSLRYWASEMGVDGFRFDLAPVLGRSLEGFSANAPFFARLKADPVLSRLKLIAEPWDIGPGGYQLGEFPLGWSEWNDKYRDSVRSFWRGDDHVIGELAGRLSGSKELFAHKGRRPLAGINFITAHDGFTLEDLVSYEHKHNETNGEENKDGHSHNISRNYGVEGASNDPAIIDLRERQKRNMLATLFLSQGIPMLQAGDELGRTQQGNNNSYCQDNEINWIDWQGAAHELPRFIARLASIRKKYPQLRLQGFLTGEPGLKGELADISWFSPKGIPMQNTDWELPFARCFGFHLAGQKSDGEGTGQSLLVLMNAHHESVDFVLPPSSYGRNWSCVLDTSAPLSEEIRSFSKGQISLSSQCLMVLAGAVDGTVRPANEDFYTLSDLCQLHGIEETYYDISGQMHTLSDEGKRDLVRVFGTDASNPQAVDQAVRTHYQTRWQTPIPAVIILRQSLAGEEEQGIEVRVCEREMGQDVVWSIRLESGRTIKGKLQLERLALRKSLRIGFETIHQLVFYPPGQLPNGYHHLDLEIGERKSHASMIIAPAHCYQPPWMEDRERLWGIAHQLYSLGLDAGKPIGDFSDLGDMAFAAAKGGADLVGLNPLHALFLSMPERVSPYSPSSRLALNVLYLDVTKMDGYEDCPRLDAVSQSTDEIVDYTLVASIKSAAFDKLYEHFLREATPEQKSEFASYCFEKGKKLQDFALFSTITDYFDGQTMADWPKAYQDPMSPEVRAFGERHEMRIFFHCWLQWQADRQLGQAADVCSELGMKVGLYGDLAVGVALDGADCWANPSDYLRDISFGAPPDAFNAEGQNWCMPPFGPNAMTDTTYRSYIDILRENMAHCGALRIDHVMWLQRMFVIPVGAPASQGAYIRYPLDDLLAILALESVRARCVIIGEDLGTVPQGFRERMQRENILSYRLMRFETEPDGAVKIPQAYPYLALATPSSHDLPTIRGFLAARDLKQARALGMLQNDEQLDAALKVRDQEILDLTEALQIEGLLGNGTVEPSSDDKRFDELVAAISLFLARTRSALTMINLEDLAGSMQQVNVPGTVNEVPNWRHRLSFEIGALLEDEDLRRLLDLIGVERKSLAHKEERRE